MQGYQQEPNPQQWAPGRHSAPSPKLHDGVRNFMSGVYAWMAAGIVITAIVGWGMAGWASQSVANMESYMSFRLIVFFAVLGIAWFATPRIPQMQRGTAVGLFLLFSGLMGITVGWVPLYYNLGSIFSVFVATAGMFAGMAAIGFVTKKDLSGMGQFLIMALLGAIIGSLINAFVLHSAGMSMAISAIVAVVAAGLTAYHTQSIKQLYRMHGGGGNLAILGALLLYVDFVNLFLALLTLFGGSRD